MVKIVDTVVIKQDEYFPELVIKYKFTAAMQLK